MKSIRMGIVALFLAIAGIFSLGAAAPASAADSGWVLQGWGDGSPSYGGCLGYLRVWDSPYGLAIGAIHEYTDCDMTGGYQKAALTWSGGAQNWYSFAGHYDSSNHWWSFVAFNVGACHSFAAQIHSQSRIVGC